MNLLEFRPEGATPASHGSIFYRSFGGSSQGFSFQLFLEYGQEYSTTTIDKAKRWLRNNRDVLSIELVRESKPKEPTQYSYIGGSGAITGRHYWI